MTTNWTWHGGGLAAAKRHFGDGAEPWLDLSTGINPHPWPGVDAIDIDWQRLPERGELMALEAAASSSFGVDPRHVCAVPGTEIGLRLAGLLIGGGARYLTPTYRTHGEMIAGATSIALEEIPHHDGTLILANPNNPDGRVVARDALLDLAERRGNGGWLLLDEAFADTDPTTSLADHIGERRRLIIFRSFGKFFGLAGVRLGFVLGPTTIMTRLRDMLGAWPVSAAAAAIGALAYRDTEWIVGMRRRLASEAAELDAMLARHGFEPIGACPLFRLIEAENAIALFEHLARQAILIRPFADNPRWLRLGLPADMAAMTRLERALADG